VLSAEEPVVQYHKPPIYTARLRVSEKQRSNTALLDGVLANETQPQPLQQAQSQAPRAIQRAIVGLFLMLVLAVVLLSNGQISPPQSLYPQDLLAMYTQIEALPANSHVLVAFDYEPAYSGEMRFAASMVLDHLMRRKALLAVVSTVPTGPALADQLIQNVIQDGQLSGDYDPQTRVENLCYLPGGTLSLAEFARSPRESAPTNCAGADAWSGSVLSGVNSLQDFQAVVVLTDRAEVGRAWVEQVQSMPGNNVPLLVVSSAQAAPMLEPYFESRQIQGMVSGLLGGVLYGQRADRQDNNLAGVYWGSYQMGMLIAFLLVLVGGFFSMAVALFRPKNQREGGRG